MNKVTFSIIIPTRNRANTGLLERSIKSVLSQKAGEYDFEIVVVDDASTDQTDMLISKIAEKNPEIKYVKLKNNLGTPAALKEGISRAVGEYIVILADDDLLPKESLLERAKFVAKNPELDWFYGKTEWIDENDRPTKTWSQSEEHKDSHYSRMYLYNYIQGGTTTVKKKVFDKIEWPNWLTTRDDDFIAFELVRPGKYKFKFLNKVLYNYRVHNIGGKRESQRNLEDSKRMKEREIIDRKIRTELHDPEMNFLADKVKEKDQEVLLLNEKIHFLSSELAEREERLTKIYNSIIWKPISLLIKARNIFKK